MAVPMVILLVGCNPIKPQNRLESAAPCAHTSAVHPLFDGIRRKWRVEQQQALVNQLRTETQQTLLAAITEVEQPLNKLEGEQRMINRLSHREQQASANPERAHHLYDKGAADALHVIEANDFSLILRRQLLQTRYQHVASTIALIRALGDTLADAVVFSGQRRLRPILLTSLTTFFGLWPMILEDARAWLGCAATGTAGGNHD